MVPRIRRAALLIALLCCAAPPAAHAQDDAAEELPILEGPRLLTYVEADYPEALQAAGVEGDVEVLVELDEAGKVTYVEVLTGLDPVLDEAALAAVRAMTFTPARTAAGPVSIAFPFTYAFKLPEADAPAEAPAAARPAPAKADAPPGDVDPAELPIVQGPQILTYVEAPYPPEAEAAGVEGTVVLMITLTAEGAVEDAVVTRPAGNGFDEAALEAVRAMTFSPAMTEAGPVGVVFEFSYAFTLTPETPAEELPKPVNVVGQVKEMGTREGLEGVIVRLEGTDQSTTTDKDGRFELRGVPAGMQMVRVVSPDHVAFAEAVEVVQGELTEATLWLRALTYRENEAVGYYERERVEVTRRTLSIEEVKRIPGTFGDPVKVIQTLPGAARSPFGTGLLIIRGANPEDTAVYVDGIRIPIVYHLTGTTSVLSPEVVESVDYLPGGYGVQYGRSQAGTVNVNSKESVDRDKFVWQTDILDTQLWYQGNLGKKKNHGLMVGARRSYIDLFIPLFTRNLDFRVRPVYWDYQLKYIPKLGEDDDFSIFVYGFQDIIRVSTPDDVAQGTDPDTQGDLRTTYQSHRIVAHYAHRFSDKLDIDIRPSIGVDVTDLGLGSDFGLFNWNVIAQVRGEVSWRPTPFFELQPGVDFIGGPYFFRFQSPVSFADLDDPLADRDPVGFDGRGTAWSTAPYVKTIWRPLKDRDQWLINVGLRFDSTAYVVAGGITDGIDVPPTIITSWDPRFATRLRVWEKGDQSFVLKASTGLYSQPPQPFESIGLGVSAQLLAERSWNTSFGFEHAITPAVNWNVEGFYRQMDRLVSFNDAFTGFGTQPFTNAGQGYAAGFEVMVRHNPVNKFFGWLSYTFSRSFRRDNPDAPYFPFDFDQPHIFSAQGGYRLPFDIGLSAQVQIVSGNPDTAFNAGVYDVDGDFYNGFRIGPGNGERLPTFVQTSFRIDKTWTFRTWQLDTYVDFINAIRGVNPETTAYSYDFAERAYVRGLPFIPNIGFEVRFFP